MPRLSAVVGVYALLMPCAFGAPKPCQVPLPQQIAVQPSAARFEFGETLTVGVPQDRPEWQAHAKVFGVAAQRLTGLAVRRVAEPAADIRFEHDADLPAEAYRLAIDAEGVRVNAASIKGLAHATATLLQQIGPDGSSLPAAVVEDQPEHAYRSVMIDLGRNPHGIACLKETIDLLWFYKVDSLHLHLTDDQRFAFPSRAFPKLQSPGEAIPWEAFEDLERYASERGVTLIPELEVPGHSVLLRKHYPEVFGESATDVARLPSSRAAIKTLLDEMIAVFPSSPYVHIGGDEAFGVPEALQRDLINDLHAHLKHRGKKTVVWEGPSLGSGDNKVDEEVIHLNWRTINFPADQMLEAGYPVVNAAWDPLYVVDHYPRNNFTMVSPQRVYERLGLTRFAHFNPDIRTFAEPIVVEPSDQLIGFCLPWWEGREENFFPLITPRLIPMAAVAWNPDAENDYDDFAERTKAREETRAICFYPVTIQASPLALETEGVFHHQTTITLASDSKGEVRYTLDGSEPTAASALYEEPFALAKSTVVRVASFVDGQASGHGSRRTLVKVEPIDNLALGKPVTASVGSGPLLSPARLTDGGIGNLHYFLGYPAMPEPIGVTIDLGEPTEFDRIVVHTYTSGRSYESYEVQISQDGLAYRRVAERLEKPQHLTSRVIHDFPSTSARYVRVVTHGHKGQVFDSFSRMTEVQVFAVETDGSQAPETGPTALSSSPQPR